MGIKMLLTMKHCVSPRTVPPPPPPAPKPDKDNVRLQKILKRIAKRQSAEVFLSPEDGADKSHTYLSKPFRASLSPVSEGSPVPELSERRTSSLTSPLPSLRQYLTPAAPTHGVSLYPIRKTFYKGKIEILTKTGTSGSLVAGGGLTQVSGPPLHPVVPGKTFFLSSVQPGSSTLRQSPMLGMPPRFSPSCYTQPGTEIPAANIPTGQSVQPLGLAPGAHLAQPSISNGPDVAMMGVFQSNRATYDPPRVKTPTYEHWGARTPTYDPLRVKTPTYEPLRVKTPTYDPPRVKTPTYDLPRVKTPTYDLPRVKTPTYDPTRMKTPTYDPPRVKTPTYDPSGVKTPTYDPPRVKTPTYDPPGVKTPTYEHRVAMTLIYDLPRVKTPTYDPPWVKTPTYDPPRVKTLTYDPPRVKTPTYDPPRVKTPTYDPPRVKTPTYDPPRVKTPTYDPLRARTPTYEPPRVKTPTYDLPRVKTPTFEPLRVKTPTFEPLRVKTPTFEPLRVKTPTFEPLRVKTPTYEPPRVKTPTYDPPNVKTPTYDPSRARTPTYELPWVKTPTYEPPRVKTPTFEIPREKSFTHGMLHGGLTDKASDMSAMHKIAPTDDTVSANVEVHHRAMSTVEKSKVESEPRPSISVAEADNQEGQSVLKAAALLKTVDRVKAPRSKMSGWSRLKKHMVVEDEPPKFPVPESGAPESGAPEQSENRSEDGKQESQNTKGSRADKMWDAMLFQMFAMKERLTEGSRQEDQEPGSDKPRATQQSSWFTSRLPLLLFRPRFDARKLKEAAKGPLKRISSTLMESGLHRKAIDDEELKDFNRTARGWPTKAVA